MATYRVREGRRYGPGKLYGPGDLVQLDPREAAPLLDILELVGDEEGEAVIVSGDDGAHFGEATFTPVTPQAQTKARRGAK
ncbi:MAG: hypothetical protein WBC13_00815 [Dokdonella sp.]